VTIEFIALISVEKMAEQYQAFMHQIATFITFMGKQ
jgi:hypothetical protein